MVVKTSENEIDRLMRDGQAAAKRGDKVMARALLTQLLERDPQNEKAWMWLSGAVGDPFEQQTCLENVLIINPGNDQARKGLEFVVKKTKVPSQVLESLRSMKAAAPSAPLPASFQDPMAGGPVDPFPFSADAASADASAASFTPEPPAPWASTASEHTAPLADVPDFSDFADPALPASSELPPWAQPNDPLLGGSASTLMPWETSAPDSPDFSSFDFTIPSAASAASVPAPLEGAAPLEMPPMDAFTAQPWDGEPNAPGAPAAPAALGATSASSGVPEIAGFDAFAPPSGVEEAPDWATMFNSPAQAPAPVTPQEGSVDGIEPFDMASLMAAPLDEPQTQQRQSLLPAGDAEKIEEGIDAWLSQLADKTAGQQTVSSNPADPFAAPLGDPFAPPLASAAGREPEMPDFADFSMAAPADPYGSMDLGPMGPYTANVLPSPDELPGAHHHSDSSQPWYIGSSGASASASSAQDVSIESPYGYNEQGYSNGYDDGYAEQAKAKDPASMMTCPHCQAQVPDTSLACPDCRFNFFVHCPGCHELIDTSQAIYGVMDHCPYCGMDVNRFELGQMYAKDLHTPTVAAPVENKDAWVGTVLHPPKEGFKFSFAWVVDVVWMAAIVMVVWALTQLPAWFNLTDLYH